MYTRFFPPLALLLLGCRGTPPAEAPRVEDSPYYPLKVGANWVYRAGKHRMTREVVRHELIGKIACARVESKRDGKLWLTEHVHATTEGVFLLALESKPLATPLRLLKLPPRPGDHWETKSRDGSGRHVYLLEEGDVTVPAGSYRAMILRGEVVEDGRRHSAFTYWFAPGVGVVKQLVHKGNETAVYELERFEIP